MNRSYRCCTELPPCPYCPDSCLWETSYDVTNVSFQYSRSFDTNYACEVCYDPGSYGTEAWSINVSGVQLGNITVTRYGTPGTGDCCYIGTGTATITYTIERTSWQWCCAFVNAPQLVKTFTENFSGNEDVPICITATCMELPIQACEGRDKFRTKWRHTLTVCGFPISATHTTWDCFVAPGDPECPTVNPCNEIEGGSLWMNGARFEWFSDLIDPALIDDLDVVMGACADTPAFCATSPEGTEVCFMNIWNGDPFGVWVAEDDWDPQDAPEPCDLGTEDLARPLFSGANGFSDWCYDCGNIVVSNPCARTDAGLQFSRWNYA